MNPAVRGTGTLVQFRRLSRYVAASDALCILVAFTVPYGIAFGRTAPSLGFLLVMALAVPVWLGIFASFRLYELHLLAPSEEFRRIFGALALGVVLVATTSFWSRVTVSRTWIALAWLFSLVLTLVARRLWHAWLHRARVRGGFTLRTLVVGSNDEARQLVHRLRSEPFGFLPVGVVATDGRTWPALVPATGSTRAMADAIHETGAECLFVASTAVAESDMLQILTTARRAGAVVWVSANLPEVLSARLSARNFGDVVALSLRPVRLSGWQVVAKRAFDVLLGGAAYLLALPFCALIALAILASSRGPVLFRQERVTKGGRPFVMYKFRTMRVDAEALLEGQAADPTSPFFKLRDDPRLTAVGRLLRRTSLDELPQLWNVLRGDMSLVGPRPLPSVQVRANPGLLEPRHEVRAGLTGWWQINGRSDLDPRESERLDRFYIENWSLMQDLFILAKTVPVVLSGKGAL